jgi:hypothetical protein
VQKQAQIASHFLSDPQLTEFGIRDCVKLALLFWTLALKYGYISVEGPLGRGDKRTAICLAQMSNTYI